jgi:hypothetical protein
MSEGRRPLRGSYGVAGHFPWFAVGARVDENYVACLGDGLGEFRKEIRTSENLNVRIRHEAVGQKLSRMEADSVISAQWVSVADGQNSRHDDLRA